MSGRDALRALERSGPLTRMRIRVVRWPFVTTIAVALAMIFVGNVQSGPRFMVVLAPLMIVLSLWGDAAKKYRASEESLAEALAAFHRGNLAQADKALIAFLRGRPFESAAAVALLHLGLTAMRTLRFADAARYFAASRELDRRGSSTARAQGYLAIASVGANDLVAARAAVDEAPRGAPSSAARAQLLLARALVALRSADPASSLSALDAKRPLLDNMLTGNDAALVDALEAAALGALAATSSGATRTASSVAVDHASRGFVLHLVPECAPFLVEA